MSRALVLGGGGPVGIAWESGLINGLAEQGVDVSRADFIIGTSAGAFVGARLALGHDPLGFAAPFIADTPSASQRERPTAQASPAPDLSVLSKLMQDAQSGKQPAEAMLALGRYALEAQTMSEDAFIASFGSGMRELPDNAWPSRPFACTAVDAESGAFALWTGASKVGVKRAVAASCSVPGIYPTVTINGRRYMDGGMRSTLNADMAKGHAKVLVIAVRADSPGAMGERLRVRRESEFKVLRDAGGDVMMIQPDSASVSAMGANLMDFRRRAGAAAAGLSQGRVLAASLQSFWV